MGVNDMPTNEKEINCYLLDRLELTERLEIVADDSEAVKKQLAIEKSLWNVNCIKIRH